MTKNKLTGPAFAAVAFVLVGMHSERGYAAAAKNSQPEISLEQSCANPEPIADLNPKDMKNRSLEGVANAIRGLEAQVKGSQNMSVLLCYRAALTEIEKINLGTAPAGTASAENPVNPEVSIIRYAKAKVEAIKEGYAQKVDDAENVLNVKLGPPLMQKDDGLQRGDYLRDGGSANDNLRTAVENALMEFKLVVPAMQDIADAMRKLTQYSKKIDTFKRNAQNGIISQLWDRQQMLVLSFIVQALDMAKNDQFTPHDLAVKFSRFASEVGNFEISRGYSERLAIPLAVLLKRDNSELEADYKAYLNVAPPPEQFGPFPPATRPSGFRAAAAAARHHN